MAENVAISHNVAVTNINVTETTFTWAVNNFSFAPRTCGSRVYSPVFATTNNKNIIWRLDFYPNGNSNSSNMFLYLTLVKSNKFKIDITYEFSIINKNGSLEKTVEALPSTFYEGSSKGFEILIARNNLEENADLLPNNTLTIFCKIKARLGFQNAAARIAIASPLTSGTFSPVSIFNVLQPPTVQDNKPPTTTTYNPPSSNDKFKTVETNLPVNTTYNGILPYWADMAYPISNGLQLPIIPAYNLVTSFANTLSTSVIYVEKTSVRVKKNFYKRKNPYDKYKF